MEGFIKLHRKMLSWGWYHDSNTKALFIHILLTASFTQNEWMGYRILPGQLITGRKRLSLETGLSERQIRTSLRRLEQTGEINIKSTNKFSIITVCKWDDYQVMNEANDQQTTSKRPANDQQTTTTKECKEGKKERRRVENVKFSPPSFDEVKKYCQERSNRVDAAAFIDFYHAKGWKIGKTTMKDWQAAVRTWENRDKKTAQPQKISAGW
jgi:predicted transcriptional regulator